MTRATPDPTRWLTDLLESGHLRWPTPDVSAVTKAMTAAAEPWTKAVGDLTKLQMETFSTLTKGWAAMLPGAPPRSPSRTAGSPTRRGRRTRATRPSPAPTSPRPTCCARPSTPRRWTSAARRSGASRCGQVMDALSPANMLATNPEAMQLALETGGASLVEGMRLFTEDLARGRIAMTDESAFEVGRNVATTPGTVVLQNELIQLIQYTPTTAQVYKRPLVIVPPCINKYYILDLQPANSFVAHAVAEGPHGVPGVLAQRGRRAGHPDLGRLPRARRARRDRRGARDHQGRQGQHARVLHRRHAAGQRARGPGRARRAHRRRA